MRILRHTHAYTTRIIWRHQHSKHELASFFLKPERTHIICEVFKNYIFVYAFLLSKTRVYSLVTRMFV